MRLSSLFATLWTSCALILMSAGMVVWNCVAHGAESFLQIHEIRPTGAGREIVVSWPDGFTNRLDIYRCTNLIEANWSCRITTHVDTETNRLSWTDSETPDLAIGFYAIGNADLDSDDDWLADARECRLYHSNPNKADTDEDGMPDGWEVVHGFNPNSPASVSTDSDYDGATDLDEYLAGMDPVRVNLNDHDHATKVRIFLPLE